MEFLSDLKHNKGSHLVHINMRSIRNKYEQMCVELTDNNLDVTTMSETWLDSRDADHSFSLVGYNFIRHDREWGTGRVGLPKRGGGLCMYVHKREYTFFGL